MMKRYSSLFKSSSAPAKIDDSCTETTFDITHKINELAIHDGSNLIAPPNTPDMGDDAAYNVTLPKFSQDEVEAWRI
ncbi:hypothetical protein DICA1_C17986 [Diutina catenulata]